MLAVCVLFPWVLIGLPTAPTRAPVTRASQDPAPPPPEEPPPPSEEEGQGGSDGESEPPPQQGGGEGEQKSGEEETPASKQGEGPAPAPPTEGPEADPVEPPDPLSKQQQGQGAGPGEEQPASKEPGAESAAPTAETTTAGGAAALAGGAGPEVAGAAPGAVGPQPAAPPPPSLPAFAPKYRSIGEVAGMLASMAAASPGVANTFELGRTYDDLPVHGIEFGVPGAMPLDQRPTVFLFGGLDGRSLVGGEAVLSIAHALLSKADELPPDVAFVAVPWTSGQALSWIAVEGGTAPAHDGRNGRPLDDDRDGSIDEDGPDDLDGDGMILDMLIEDPRGPWARGGDGRFLVPAGPGVGTRYLWTREGRDDDGDGRFNEDPPGGVVLDRNFPVHRTGPWDDPRCGEVPMSEVLSRAVADLVLRRRAAVVLLVQGNHGCLATPGGVGQRPGSEAFDPADRPVFERVTEAFLAATGRQQDGVRTLLQARGSPSPGAALDWLHAVSGALSLELAPWGPGVEANGDVAAKDARFAQPRDAALQAPRSLDDRPHLGDIESAWARWLDNTRGGLGFVDWQPVELDGGRQGLVGGWEPRTILNPPPEILPRAIEGLPTFVRELAESLPRLDVRITKAERDGDLLRLRAQVRNLGRLPTGMIRPGAPGLELALELPGRAQLIAGEPVVRLPRLLGGELSAEAAWVVVAPEGAVLGLRASAEWTVDAVVEVKP